MTGKQTYINFSSFEAFFEIFHELVFSKWIKQHHITHPHHVVHDTTAIIFLLAHAPFLGTFTKTAAPHELMSWIWIIRHFLAAHKANSMSSIRAMSHGANFLATCNAVLLVRDAICSSH